MSRREQAERRILQHARAGYSLAMADPAYRARAHERLLPSLQREPGDLWEAIDWTWAEVLGVAQATGPLSGAVEAGARVLRELLSGEDGAATRWSRATHDQLSLTSTLRSHPFPDQSAWLLRKMSHAS